MGGLREVEARMYWSASSAMRSAKQNTEDISTYVDELQVIAEHSDWPLLKTICAASVAGADDKKTALCVS